LTAFERNNAERKRLRGFRHPPNLLRLHRSPREKFHASADLAASESPLGMSDRRSFSRLRE
jgi:hypothetical protein